MDKLIIGIPTETKENECRVALTPKECAVLTQTGHTVNLQAGAGEAADFEDTAYTAVGVSLQPDAASLYANSQLIVKVKEPQAGDLQHLTVHHTLFCYLHLAAEPALTQTLQKIGLTAVAFETVVVDDATPLLAPMSAIAGRLATQIGTWFLHAPRGGRGVLLGGITGHPAAGGQVTVLGAGIAGTEAATLAHNMGANVTILDINEEKLSDIKQKLPNITTKHSTSETISEILPKTDLLVGAVYVIGKEAPKIVSRQQIATMPQGAVVVDIAIDQGGCIETSRPCTHANPTYREEGIIHSAITNLPAAAPFTASTVLAEAILPYVQTLAEGRWTPELTTAINVQNGDLKISL